MYIKDDYHMRKSNTVITLTNRTPPILTILVLKFEQVPFTTYWCVYIIVGWVANSVEPDQTPLSGVWSGSTQFAQVCLSDYLVLMQYHQ